MHSKPGQQCHKFLRKRFFFLHGASSVFSLRVCVFVNCGLPEHVVSPTKYPYQMDCSQTVYMIMLADVRRMTQFHFDFTPEEWYRISHFLFALQSIKRMVWSVVDCCCWKKICRKTWLLTFFLFIWSMEIACLSLRFDANPFRSESLTFSTTYLSHLRYIASEFLDNEQPIKLNINKNKKRRRAKDEKKESHSWHSPYLRLSRKNISV